MSVCICGHPLNEHLDGACYELAEDAAWDGVRVVFCACSRFVEDESATAAREDELREEAESDAVDRRIDEERGG